MEVNEVNLSLSYGGVVSGNVNCTWEKIEWEQHHGIVVQEFIITSAQEIKNYLVNTFESFSRSGVSWIIDKKSVFYIWFVYYLWCLLVCFLLKTALNFWNIFTLFQIWFTNQSKTKVNLEELHTVCNMDGLAYRFGSPSPFPPVPWWYVEGGCWTRKFCIVHLSPPPCCDCGVWVGGGGCCTPLVGLRTICAWDWGSYLLGAWTSGPECVTC